MQILQQIKLTAGMSFLVGVLFWIALGSQGLARDKVAVVIKVSGTVTMTRGGDFRSTPVKKGQILEDGDMLETGEDSFCALKFLDDKSLMRIREKSSCTIEGKREGNSIVKNVFAEVGSFFFSLFGQPRGFKATTPTSVASVKGTSFWVVQFATGETYYICTDGIIEVRNSVGKVLIRKGQTGIVTSRSQMPEVRLSRAGDFPSETEGGGATRQLDFEFTDGSGQKKVLRLELEKQE